MHPILKEKPSFGLYLIGWLPLGVLLTFVVAGAEGDRLVTAAALTIPLTLVYSFICLAAWYPCQANPLPRSPVIRALGAHLVGALLSTGLWLVLGAFWARFLAAIDPAAEELFASQRAVFFAAGVLLYLLAAALHYLLQAFESSRRAEQRALELKVLAREAELEAFRTQIDPHFLFNCLNSISSLCGTDPAAARHTAVRLGDFLRASLRLGAGDAIPLAEELRLNAAYLDVERVRFGDRLTYREEVPEECLATPIPALLLQPLVENALKHGVAHLVDGGEVRLACEKRGDTLAIRLRNDCDPARPAGEQGGIGLANVRGRLALIHGRRTEVRTRAEDDSFEVEIRLPAGESGEATAAVAAGGAG